MKQSSRLETMFSWFRRRMKVTKIERATGTRAASSTNIHVINPWHAVGVSPGKPSCRASLVARSTRYLSQEAPSLPLYDCTQPKSCTCRYKHYSDRRSGPRRRTDSDLYKNALSRHVGAKLTIDERRRSKGRRATDGR
jgi:hypothetical protein